MSRSFQRLRSLCLAATFILPLVVAGCSVHAGYRSYDPYYSDYHVWDNHERGYYTQWEAGTHRPHRDFRKRSPNEQKEYWNWRHTNHPENR